MINLFSLTLITLVSNISSISFFKYFFKVISNLLLSLLLVIDNLLFFHRLIDVVVFPMSIKSFISIISLNNLYLIHLQFYHSFVFAIHPYHLSQSISQ